MDQARVLRRQRKAAITRHLGTLARLMSEEDAVGVQARLTQMKASFEQFEIAHDAYHILLDSDEAVDESEGWFSAVEVDYIAGVKQAKLWLKSNEHVDDTSTYDDAASVVADAAPITQADLINLVSIPKVEIDAFDGNPLEYHTFMSIFDECIGNKNVDDQVKLTRLLQYTKGPAKSAIRNCALITGTEGYDQAREILQNRFGTDHMISQKLIEDLKNGKVVSKSSDLQQLADDLTMANSVLERLSLESEVDNQHTILDVLQRCPPYVRNKWRTKALKIKRENGHYPHFADFVEFIRTIASDSNDPVYGDNLFKQKVKGVNFASVTDDAPERGKTGQSKPKRVSCNTVTESNVSENAQTDVSQTESTRNVNPCVVCQMPHRLFYCDTFKSMRPHERLNVAKNHRLCFNCLLPGHGSRECKKPSVCSVPGCGRKHTKFVHVDAPKSKNMNVQNEVKHDSVPSVSSAMATSSNVYLPIVPVIVNGLQQAYALLDSGSTNTFVSESLASRLGIKGNTMTYQMSTLSRQELVSSKVVSLQLDSYDDTDPVSLQNVLVIPEICVRYPSQTVDIDKYPHLAGLPIPRVGHQVKVDLLIGMDNGNILMPLEVRSNPSSANDPYAVRTLFGWSLQGPAVGSLSQVESHFVKLEQQVENLWRMEESDNDDLSLSQDDCRVLRLWEKESKLENGHYVVPIPWREGRPNFPNNKHVALHRLQGTRNRLVKTQRLEKYSDNITKLLDEGYAERVPEDECNLNDGSVWFLPHHGVVSPSKPDKIRVVFDCSAKHSGVSLNNQCLQGPDLVNKLISVLMGFRQYQYAIMADIEAMYLQVKIPIEDRNALRFLWLENGSIVQYRMTSHLFGGVWCSSSSSYALRRTVNDHNASDLVKDTVLKAFYVDDLLKSVTSTTDAIEVIRDSKKVVGLGGFNLTKFVVNDTDVLQQVATEDRAKEVKEIMPEMFSSALGITWCISDDCFCYVNKNVVDSIVVTRRNMLSQIASMYDPMGLIGPIVLRGRSLFQEATRLKLDWDVAVPSALARIWSSWLSSLNEIQRLRFPRCLIPDGFVDGVAELHHFCDGSSVGYGACTYLRVINRQGEIRVVLVISKSRLAPLKQITIPRLELCAAVLAVKLENQLRADLDIPLVRSTFWTDSQIVLAYIRNESRRFKVFVANRVSAIRRCSSPDQWFHIDGKSNPADVLSRGCDTNGVPDTWTNGPSFLASYKSEWVSDPSRSYDVSIEDPEVSAHTATTWSHATEVSDNVKFVHPLDALTDHYSSFYRLKKAVCWLLRVRSFLHSKDMRQGPITVPEMETAEKTVIMYVQNKAFPDEIKALQQKGKVLASSRLVKLAPVLDKDVIVIGGRLCHAGLSQQAKHPVILPRDHKVSRMIILDCHNEAHLGTEWTLSVIRRRYWIVNARSMIKQAKRQCVVCKKLYGAPMVQRMSDLPPERCTSETSVFSCVGCDLFGPFYVKLGRAEVKRYGCVFSCFSTRAVHIEKLDSLETDSFINGFVRFAARRGYPRKVWSDNGTNLVGARAELSKALCQLDRTKVVQVARRRKVEWSFNPPLASHHGGVWERMIRTIRRVLYALLVSHPRMNDEVLHTVLCEVENIVNSRPITKCSDDVDDLDPLTPNHLLVMQGNYSYPWGVFHDGDTYRKRWRHVQSITAQFWRKWLREYLPELQRRPKWLNTERNITEGDLVLIIDENVQRGQWPLGLVLETKLGRDGLVRSAKVRTSSTVLVRPITKLVLLEGCF